MPSAEALRLLLPVELGEAHAADLALEGEQLDLLQGGADELLREAFPETSYSTLAAWERVYGLRPLGSDPLQVRRDRLVAKVREVGGLSVAYFAGLAAGLGYPVTIVELGEFIAGWGGAGEEVHDPEMTFVWRVFIDPREDDYLFRAGESCAGETLSWWAQAPELIALFDDLKPAHTAIDYVYTS